MKEAELVDNGCLEGLFDLFEGLGHIHTPPLLKLLLLLPEFNGPNEYRQSKKAVHEEPPPRMNILSKVSTS